ncbi:MAG: ABC transporter substrate-binding protein [Rhodospirillaceae bacterium]|nr:ABC transporter substrate-binding protein [Rhodospirillaceae bacterium]
MSYRHLAALLLGSTLIAGAASAQTVLRVVPEADLRVLDPVAVTVNLTRIHGVQIFESLFAWNDKFEPQPMMIESYSKAPDGLSYTFTLRPDLKFHDGSTVTTKDVIASLNRWMKRDAMGRRMAANGAVFEAKDDRVLSLTLKQNFAFVEFSLGSGVGQLPVIMREKEAMTDPNTPVTEAIGSGPWKFNKAEWAPGAKTVYDKFADYKPRTEPTNGLAGAKIVKVDRMEWVVLPDNTTAANALGRGEVDFMQSPSSDVFPLLKRMKDVTVDTPVLLDSQAWIRPNMLYPPFNNVKARQALALTVNQKEYLMAFIGDSDRFKECYAFFTCGGPFDTEVGSEPYRRPDMAKARQLLQESGYKGEKVYMLASSETQLSRATFPVVVEQMKAIGFNVEVMNFDWGAVIARWIKKDKPGEGGWNLFPAGSPGAVLFHPIGNFYVDLSCGGNNGAGWPCDEEGEKLRLQLLDATDPAERKQLLEAFHKRLWEYLPLIPAGQYESVSAWRTDRVQGVIKAPTLAYWNISKK